MKFFMHLLALGLFGLATAATIPTDELMRRAVTDELAHGNYVYAADQVWRWHQIAKGVFTGVEPSEWDDNVHIRNDTEPTISAHTAAIMMNNGTSPASPLLSDRSLLSTCSEQLNCAKAAVGFGLLTAANFLVDQAVKQTPKVWDFLNKPFTANLLGVGLQNGIVVAITTSATKSQAQPPQTCSSNQSQEDLLRSLIQQACEQNPNADAISYNLSYPDGSVRTLSLNAGTGKSLGGSSVCGAPGIVN